jgi:uncharacterized protein YjbI with pentapeptide repeats
MSEQAELSDKEKLELEQIRLTNEKLKQETIPEKWWSKALKYVVPIGALVTVAATAIGVWESYDKTITDRENARIADQKTQIDKAIERLVSPNTISKLVAVSVLSGYLGPNSKDLHHQILFTLAGLMATEKDPQVQAAVIDLIGSVSKEGSITHDDWYYFQDRLVSQSRALMAKGDLPSHRHFAAVPALTDEEQAARAIGKLIANNIRNGNVGGYTDYRGIYCGECNFRGAIIPERADFTGAVLDNADFSKATLRSALFNDAQIAGTKFIEADLRAAQFLIWQKSIDGADNPKSRTTYLDHIASAVDLNATVDIQMPNFSCANLDDANFGRHALFPGVFEVWRSYSKKDQAKPGWYQTVPKGYKDRAQTEPKVEFPPVQVVPPKFFNASLKNTHFEFTRFFIVTREDVPNYMGNSEAIPVAELQLSQGDIADTAFEIPSDKDFNSSDKTRYSSVRDFQRTLRASFHSAEIEHASLSPIMRSFLKQRKPTRDDYLYGFHSFDLLMDDTDSQCTPRRN